jgi:hypothetical protein
MRGSLFYPASLILIVLVAGFTPVAPWLRAAGGAVLLGLWLYGLLGPTGERRSVGYLPGHALLMLGLGLVGARIALFAWLFIPLGSLAYEALRLSGRTRPAAVLYAVVWLDIFACLHQLVALGKGLSGTGLWLWSAVLGALALGFVSLGVLRLWAPRPGADERTSDIG